MGDSVVNDRTQVNPPPSITQVENFQTVTPKQCSRHLLGWVVRHMTRWEIAGSCSAIGFLILFSPLIDGGTTQLPVLVIRLTLLASVVLWFLDGMKSGTLRLPWDHLALAVFLFSSLATLSLIWAPYKNAAVQWVMSILLYALLFMLLVQRLNTKTQVLIYLRLILGMGIFQGIVGIAQYMWLGEERARGTFFNPNFFATYEAAVLLVALGLVLFLRQNEKSAPERVFIGTTIAITSVAFVLAQSRGALLALIGGISILGFSRFGKQFLAIATVCLAVGIIVPNPLSHRVINVGAEDPYAYTRLDIWKSSLSRLADTPLGIGVGMYKHGSFQDRFPIKDSIVRYWKRPESAHNEYLQIGVELGIPGLVIFLLGIGIWAWNARQLWFEQQEEGDRGLVIGLTAATCNLLLHALVDSTFHEPALVILLILCAGCVYTLRYITKPETLPWKQVSFLYHPSRAVGIVLGGLSLAVVCVQSTAGWYLYEQGKQEARLGRLEQAIDWYVRATTIDPGTTGYHDAAARTATQLFYESGSPEWLVQAASEESIALKLNGRDGRFAYRLGAIYRLMAGQHISIQKREELLEQAASYYREAMRLDPFSPFSYFDLAQMYRTAGRLGDAIVLLKIAKNHEPNFLPGRALLAELSVQAGIPGDYGAELAAIRTVLSTYGSGALNETERQFMSVDLTPLERALALELIQ